MTREYTYDAFILPDYYREQLANYPDLVEVRFSVKINSIERGQNEYFVHCEDGNAFSSNFILNATYAGTNQILAMVGFENFKIKMDDKEKNFVSAVVYVHNDEKHVENFLHSEIIFVNDTSSDDTAQIIKTASKQIPVSAVNVSIINLSFYHGVELAMNAGMNLAIGDFVFEFDSIISDFEPQGYKSRR